jgi:tetratricopeptide (TPR) repeat protein
MQPSRIATIAAFLAVIAVIGAAGPAAAQSQRYPQPLVDKDRENEQTSSLWERTVEPGRAPHATLLAEARRLLAVGRTDAELAQAAAKANQAIALRPKDAAAYLVRAVAMEQLRQWSDCASNYQTALELDPKLDPDPELRGGSNPLLGLGICQARAGKLAAAELALDRAVSRAPIGIEEWLRLGEVRIAMGKLREGLDALTASTEASGEAMPTALNNWLRALAYDRARQTALADEAGAAAALADRYLGQLNNQGTPFIHDVERYSLLALGYQYTARLEVSLAYQRRVVAAAPDGMWARRAREHVELLEQTAFPEELRRAGPAPVDVLVARTMVRKAMPALAACAAAVPSVAFDLRITRSRPAQPGSGPRAVPRPPGASASSAMIDQPTLEPIERAQTCLQEIALKLELPPVKDPGTWYELAFSVIAARSRP